MAKSLHSRVVIKKPTVKFKKFKKEETNVGYAYRAEHRAEIHIGQTDKELFLTVCHEIIGHLTLPDLSEKQVIRLERIVCDALWLTVLRLKKKWRK